MENLCDSNDVKRENSLEPQINYNMTSEAIESLQTTTINAERDDLALSNDNCFRSVKQELNCELDNILIDEQRVSVSSNNIRDDLALSNDNCFKSAKQELNCELDNILIDEQRVSVSPKSNNGEYLSDEKFIKNIFNEITNKSNMKENNKEDSISNYFSNVENESNTNKIIEKDLTNSVYKNYEEITTTYSQSEEITSYSQSEEITSYSQSEEITSYSQSENSFKNHLHSSPLKINSDSLDAPEMVISIENLNLENKEKSDITNALESSSLNFIPSPLETKERVFKQIENVGDILNTNSEKNPDYDLLSNNDCIKDLIINDLLSLKDENSSKIFKETVNFEDSLKSINEKESDSNMMTASEGAASLCSPLTSDTSKASSCFQFVSENNQEEPLYSREEKEIFDGRGDADGCAQHIHKNEYLYKYDENLENHLQIAGNCSCKRTNIEQDVSVLLNIWNELRSSLRQLHRSVLSSPLSSCGIVNPRNRPSINRIKILSNMLLENDAHHLFTRLNQLNQELCIELKVRLLTTIHDKPEFDEAVSFVKGLCESYECVINICDSMKSAFEKLDTEHLSKFGLNWMTVNMHTFYSTMFTDFDVQDYLSICEEKVKESDIGKEALGCLESLRRTLSVAEGVWSRAESSLQEYNLERAAFNAQRRQLLSEWGLKNRKKFYPLTTYSGSGLEKSGTASQESNHDAKGALDNGANQCECHFCNSSSTQIPPDNVLSGGTVPAVSQPQLSLYPHIHGTSANVPNSTLKATSTASLLTKLPLFANPYLGSDFLTEQLIREWDSVYGDKFSSTQPSSLPMNATRDFTTDIEKSLEDLNLVSDDFKSARVALTQEKSHGGVSTIGSSLSKVGCASCQQPSSNYSTRTPTNTNGISDIDSTEGEEWSSENDNERSSSESSINHKSQCDCCYCNTLRSLPRQKYADRKHILRMLNRKKKSEATKASTMEEAASKKGSRREEKRARQKERKKLHRMNRNKLEAVAALDSDKLKKAAWDAPHEEESEEEEEEEEEDGPLAELRRRAPDVTITVVKPTKAQMNESLGGNRHPLMAKPEPNTNNNKGWNSEREKLGREISSAPSTKQPVSSLNPSSSSGPPGSNTGLSSLLKGMEKGQQEKDAGKNSSQMVTIRRVMDPVSSEPTVTITLKGEEPKKDKVLFKLVNGQACPGDPSKKGGNKAAPTPKVKKPQEKPIYDIPEGTAPEEAKKMKKKQKRERQKQRKELEKIEEKKLEELKQLQLKKQREYLKQQEKQIKKQQAALQKQLAKQNEKGKKKAHKITKEMNERKNNKKGKSAKLYEDDVARNFNLPPGVSINKVAGQPGMVTISNTMGNPFGQPFISDPRSVYPNPLISGYGDFSQGYQMPTSGYPPHGMFGGCGPGVSWNGAVDPCSGTPQESVIVVDTKSSVPKVKDVPSGRAKMNKKKSFDQMTSEEKIEAAVKGHIDACKLNQTQKKKYKKRLKAIKEEEEHLLQKQREEDELMDRMYEIAKSSDATVKGKNAKHKEQISNKMNGGKVGYEHQSKGKHKVTEKGNTDTQAQIKNTQSQKSKSKQKQQTPNLVSCKVTNNKTPAIQQRNKPSAQKGQEQPQTLKRHQEVKQQQAIKISKDNNKQQPKIKSSQQKNHNAPSSEKASKTVPATKHVSGKTKSGENIYSYGPTMGYAAGDFGHEARYAQYLAANASTLASVEYEANQMQPEKIPNKAKKRGGKLGHLEDLTTIDSVFTPKDVPGGELDDETDREVEAFKRFCLYNVPRNSGEKPKVNFNVKDIMIKKKH